MAAEHVIDIDLARVVDDQGDHVTTLAWGDAVEVLEIAADGVRIGLTRFVEAPDGSILPSQTAGRIPKPSQASGLRPADVVAARSTRQILKVDFIDVQQGDASVIETPQGKVMLVDGGENQLFARYLAARYGGTSLEAPLDVDCIVVTHGDADHFAGLSEIHESETNPNRRKRLFMRPRRVYHNGLVKRPSTVTEAQQLGATTVVDGRTFITGLEEDLLTVPDTAMNTHFRRWKRVLRDYAARQPIAFRRLSLGDDAAFDFLAGEGLRVEVLGPILADAGGVPGLLFLGEPRKGGVGHPSLAPLTFTGKSASHTINGHSIVLRLTYGDWRLLYAGDLNAQAEAILLEEHRKRRRSLRSEVLKVPHHGSADFTPAFLQAAAPVVSVVSSGDESARKEYIHPRATLVTALGRASRSPEPVLFVTELVAFFEVEGWVTPPGSRRPFFAFSRSAYGTVKIRTDGARLLVYTNSGQQDLKEAYAYTLERGRAVPQLVRQV